MKIFITVLVLIFSFQSWAKADDIRDFEIEGMSIEDSLLDYFTEDEIKKALTETELQGESRYYFKSNLLVYDRLRIYVLNKNNKIVSITGENFIKYEKCLNLQKEIIIEFNNLFDLSSAQIGELSDFVTVNDPTGKSFFTDYSIYFKNNDVVYVRCFNYTEESKMGDRMEVAVVLKVHRDIIKKSIGSAKEK
jgi:hypothetical protein